MKSNNNIYSFFIALALLFWNPISYFLIYGNTAIFSVKVNHIFYGFYSIVFVVGILLIYLVNKNKFNEKIKKIILTVTFTGILFSVFVMIDSFIGLTTKKELKQVQKQGGLIFEPNSQARYQTTEFDYLAKINSLGLRDREVNIKKGNMYRILCFGDSWTFGFGVNIENSWPKKLEQFFHEKEINNIEVINCGQGGQYTTTYKINMSKAVPLLKPDLVLVGVLQLDDLSQLYENNYEISSSASILDIQSISNKAKDVIQTYLKASFVNILTMTGDKTSKPIEIKLSWKASANNMISGFNHIQKLRFYTLEDSVQKLFKSGNLNPSLLSYYIYFPDKCTIFNNPNHPATKFAIKEMDKDVKDMKAICQNNNCNLIFINLPEDTFTGNKDIRTPRDRDVLNPYFEKNNKIDSIYHSIATSNCLPYIQLTEYFLSLEHNTKYFFLYDGHPNEKGYEEIANYIGKQLIEQNLIKNK
jgi:lysophospholipase L1-like esterase